MILCSLVLSVSSLLTPLWDEDETDDDRAKLRKTINTSVDWRKATETLHALTDKEQQMYNGRIAALEKELSDKNGTFYTK